MNSSDGGGHSQWDFILYHHSTASQTLLHRLILIIPRVYIAPVAGPAEASLSKYTASVRQEQAQS